ncbi:hypothetical protein DEU56DRAFT_770937 [Suillus clintonianus]|uniref:uncharacterized protein n=1 Tax=Suillus clintonianus TaxID=1904413 RepID=UPI001B873DF1|nr:uncharacterized protein DEU56DRAFT_770937 [Suillus clintonianus]KAG2154877.1 hypothetical protein DEU56DRAFT_770937 [Suillus clintonianus]
MYLLSFLLALPLLSLAQSSQSVQLSTSTIVLDTLGSNRQASTVTQITVFTVTPALTASATNSASGNSSAITSGGTNGTTTSIASSNLPTAASTVAGADGGANGAPSPGATASGGIYGPPDGYIAGAKALRSANILGVVVFVVGGALVLL